MKGMLLALVLLGLPLCQAAAQLFSIEAEALNSPTGSSTALIEVRATTQPGFSATIFISAEAPTLPDATITITPSMINAPYSDSATITIHAPQPGDQTSHQIVVIGKNGPSIAYDTVLVEFPDRSAWKWLTGEALEGAGMSGYSQVLVDRQNSVAYLIGNDEIGVWDGESVTKLSTFPHSSREGGSLLVSSTLDSVGRVWILKNGVLRRYDIGSDEWMMIDHSDPANGISDTLITALSPTSPNRPGRVQTGSDGKVWIMSTTGLFCYNPETSTWQSWLAKNSEFAVSSWANLPTYTTDFNGNVWIAQKDALVKFDGAYTTVYSWSELLNIPLFDGRYAEVFGVDSEYGIWVRVPVPAGGVNNVGVWTFDDQMGRVERYVPYDEASIVEAFPVDSVHLDSPIGFLPNQVERATGAAGDIWLALQPAVVDEYRARYRVNTEGGLMRYLGGVWYHYTSENSGLPSNTVTSVVGDSRDQVWIKANGGLVLLDGTLPPEEAFSDISAVADESLTESSLRLYPNPLSGDAELESCLPAGSWEPSIYSVLGQEVLSLSEFRIEGGHSRMYLPTGHLPPGVYFLQLTDDAGNRMSTMFIRE